MFLRGRKMIETVNGNKPNLTAESNLPVKTSWDSKLTLAGQNSSIPNEAELQGILFRIITQPGGGPLMFNNQVEQVF